MSCTACQCATRASPAATWAWADSICASLPRALFQPCFNVVQTSPNSFRGSLKAFGFAYCDFVRRNPRLDLARGETNSDPAESAIALRPSRY